MGSSRHANHADWAGRTRVIAVLLSFLSRVAPITMGKQMINIVSCVWKRPERLTYTLMQLEKQINRNFSLSLINNNCELVNFVEQTIDTLNLTYSVQVIHNKQNRGPFARWETMYQCKDDSDWFMTLDDDAIFDDTLIEQWARQRERNVMLGWNGFLFSGDYWTRIDRQPGEHCDYLWGSNLCLDARLIDENILGLPQRYWNCDDLWACGYCKYTKGAQLKKADINNFSINVDGKDTYIRLHGLKIEALNWMRESFGWFNRENKNAH